MAGAAAIVSVETSAKANEYGVELNYGTSIHKIQYGIRSVEKSLEEANKLICDIRLAKAGYLNYTSSLSSGAFTSEVEARSAEGYWSNMYGIAAKRLNEIIEIIRKTLNEVVTCLDGQLVSRINGWNLRMEQHDWNCTQRISIIGGTEEVCNENLLNRLIDHRKKWFEHIEKETNDFSRQIITYGSVIQELRTTDPQNCQVIEKCQGLENDRCRIQKYISTMNAKIKFIVVFKQPPSIVRRDEDKQKVENEDENNKNCGTTTSKIPFNLVLQIYVGRLEDQESLDDSKSVENTFGKDWTVEPMLITEQDAGMISAAEREEAINYRPASAGKIVKRSCTVESTKQGCVKVAFNGVRIQMPKPGKGKKKTKNMADNSPSAGKTKAKTGKTNNRAVTMPFTIVCNAARQEKLKEAQMFWQISFGIDDRTNLSIHFTPEYFEQIAWDEFFRYLNHWFKRAASENYENAKFPNKSEKITRGLDDFEDFFKEKIGLGEGEFVTWKMFYSESKFWDWFYPTVNFIRSEKSKCAKLWEEKLIAGFISNQEARDLLKGKTGSMTFRFSNSRPGRIVVNYTVSDKVTECICFDGKKESAIANMSLVDCIKSSPQLKHIKKVLPSNKTIRYFYNVGSATSEKIETNKRSSGYPNIITKVFWRRAPELPELPTDMRQNSKRSKRSWFKTRLQAFFKRPSFKLTRRMVNAQKDSATIPENLSAAVAGHSLQTTLISNQSTNFNPDGVNFQPEHEMSLRTGIYTTSHYSTSLSFDCAQPNELDTMSESFEMLHPYETPGFENCQEPTFSQWTTSQTSVPQGDQTNNLFCQNSSLQAIHRQPVFTGSFPSTPKNPNMAIPNEFEKMDAFDTSGFYSGIFSPPPSRLQTPVPKAERAYGCFNENSVASNFCKQTIINPRSFLLGNQGNYSDSPIIEQNVHILPESNEQECQIMDQSDVTLSERILMGIWRQDKDQ